MANRKKKKRWIIRIVLLICVVIAGGMVWSYLAPTLTAQSVTQYTPYTVENRDVSADMSFGGTVSVLHSQSVSVSESTTVREVYVEAAQSVSEGDKLIQLEDGQVLTASIDGVVNQLRARAGGYAIEGMTLVQICDLVNMQISMNVDEYDISKLYVGQPCRVYILSLKMTFDAQIAHINRVSSGSGSVAYYTASIELTVPETVLPGMQASVTIPLETAAAVPVLPVEAVQYDDEGQPFVYVKNGQDAYEKEPVTLGLNDGMYVQLLSGLSVGDTAYQSETVEISQEGFSLASLYKMVFGQTVVVNDTQKGDRSQGPGGGGTGDGGAPALEGGAPTDGDMPAMPGSDANGGGNAMEGSGSSFPASVGQGSTGDGGAVKEGE